VLEVRNLARRFGGVQALRGVSFSVADGELLAMIGPNGAGKSTCFNAINGQLRPDAGEVLLDGRRIDGLPPRELAHLGVARTFQVATSFGSMGVRENVQVALAARAQRLGAVFGNLDASTVADALLDQAGIRPLADALCAELAYGDLKRVELAIALAARPRLLLMDEPTAGMAAEERRALMDLVKGVARTGVAVLFTEHDMDAVFGYADRVIALSEGELIANGTPDAVRADARVRAVYLGDEAAHA
jgi:branched-chain amino acid transport system ATP-binding protein